MPAGDNCPPRRPLTLLAITVSMATASLLLGLLATNSLIPGEHPWARTVVALLLLAIYALTLALSLSKYSGQMRVLRGLCRRCKGPMVYVPLRFTYNCRTPSGSLLCYSSTTGLIFEITPEETLSEERLDTWAPLDFYCVKPLRGKTRREESGTRIFRGEMLYVDPFHRRLVRALGSYRIMRPPTKRGGLGVAERPD